MQNVSIVIKVASGLYEMFGEPTNATLFTHSSIDETCIKFRYMS